MTRAGQGARAAVDTVHMAEVMVNGRPMRWLSAPLLKSVARLKRDAAKGLARGAGEAA